VFVNLPALQVGEEFSGELTISNYGLVRADNLVFTPASSDGLFRFEFQGEVPAQLGARERIRLNYKITALQPMPSAGRQLFDDNPLKDEPPVPLIQLSGSTSSSGGTCSSYRNRALLQYDYECANGARRGGSAGTSWGRTVGSSCGGPGGASSPNCTSGGSCGNGGGWGGGGGGVPMPGSPPCTPNCKKCCSGGGASGGGGGGGGGGSGGGGSSSGGGGGGSGGGSASGPGGPGD
jgi:hypothetical protein